MPTCTICWRSVERTASPTNHADWIRRRGSLEAGWRMAEGGGQRTFMLARRMGPLQRSAASIGFYGDDLNPDDITERLGGPTSSARKGDVALTPSGREKVSRIGYWLLNVDGQEPQNLDYQINSLLDKLTNDFKSWRFYASRFRGRIFCGLFLGDTNEGLTLRPETIARIAERGLLLDLDIYSEAQSD